ncbi:MAG TPA: hypothetical protein VFV43_01780 [Limnobacter sp.]|nr:hypothetical protein [Limnobacter sp.]
MSALECIAHVDELYIRSYPLKSNADAYGLKLIDFPVTVRMAGQVYYMRYRRGWDQCWKLFCSDEQLLALRKAVGWTNQDAETNGGLDVAMAKFFEEVDGVCAQAVETLPAYPTRRDVLQNLIEQSLLTPLLCTSADEDRVAVHFYYLGGHSLLAVLGRFAPGCEVMAVCELGTDDWRVLCADIQQIAAHGREQVDALVLERVAAWMGDQQDFPVLESAA